MPWKDKSSRLSTGGRGSCSRERKHFWTWKRMSSQVEMGWHGRIHAWEGVQLYLEKTPERKRENSNKNEANLQKRSEQNGSQFLKKFNPPWMTSKRLPSLDHFALSGRWPLLLSGWQTWGFYQFCFLFCLYLSSLCLLYLRCLQCSPANWSKGKCHAGQN